MKRKKEDLRTPDNNENQRRISVAEKEMLWRKIETTLQRKKRGKYYKYAQIAAILLCIFGLSFYLFQSKLNTNDELGIKEIAQISQNFSKKSALSQTEVVSMTDVSLNDNKGVSSIEENILTENKDKEWSFEGLQEDKRYSTIHVPYGKRFDIKLPDGTTVWLNAGSQLTFPNKFNTDERMVYLNGEAYFDVTHNPDQVFKVVTQNNIVEVLGTTFNVNAYEEDQTESVELLTGRIVFHSHTRNFKPIRLKPTEKIITHQNSKQVRLVSGTKGNSVLWSKKQLVLDKEPLYDLINKIERVYNVHIKIEDFPAISSTVYSGRVDVSIDLVEVLENIYELRDYSIKIVDKEVFMMKKKS